MGTSKLLASIQKNESSVVWGMIAELHMLELSLRREWESTTGASRSKVHRREVKEYWSRVISVLHSLRVVQQNRVPVGSVWVKNGPGDAPIDAVIIPPTKEGGRTAVIARIDNSDDSSVDIPQPTMSSFSLLASIAEGAALLALLRARGNKNLQVYLLQGKIRIPPRPARSRGRAKGGPPRLLANPIFCHVWFDMKPTVKPDSTLTSVAQAVRAEMSKYEEYRVKQPAESTIRKALSAINWKTPKDSLA